jgi:FkbM family methyltransferase
MTVLKSDLIYDVGLHRGEDTDFYLRKGFEVVAIEANPELVARCKERFRDALESGRLHIVEGAIAPQSAGETVTFYSNTRKTVFGTIDGAWAERNAKSGYGSERIELPRIDIGEVYRRFGIPFYIKIDVEGVDRLVLDGLRQFAARPRYVSMESEKVDFSALEEELKLLRDLGYTKFKPVQQAAIPGRTIRTTTLDGRVLEYVFEPHASGPFGEDIAQPWLSFDDTRKAYESIFQRYRYHGDNSLIKKMPKPIRKILRAAYRLWTGYRGPLPGWHDTHASL